MMKSTKQLFDVPPDPVPGLEDGEIHLWRAFLDVPEPVVAAREPLLSQEERNRAGRYRFADHRKRFVVARAFLREVLSGYLGVLPQSVAFTRTGRGKPVLAGDLSAEPLHFSLAHSEDVALLAVAREPLVGVDLEWLRPLPNRDGIVDRIFSDREKAAYRALPESARERGFFACWTRKEALLKALGEGISDEARRFSVIVSPDEPPGLVHAGDSDLERGPWTILDVTVGEGCFAALAIRGEVGTVRYFEWNWS